MSNELVNDILEKRLKVEWAGMTPIAWDNLSYTPKRGEAFIRSIVDSVDSEVMSGNCLRVNYIYTIQVFTPADQGSTYNLFLADTVTNIFRNFSQGQLHISNIMTERIGEDEEWHHRNVLIDVTFNNFI